jgi:hypothetical protein
MVGRASVSAALIIWISLWLGAAIVLRVVLRKVATVVRNIRALGLEEQPWVLVFGQINKGRMAVDRRAERRAYRKST